MIDLSFHNVLNGIRIQVNMVCLCPSQSETDRIYRNAVDILFHPAYSAKKNQDREIDYGFRTGQGVSIRFKNLTSYANRNWRGFRGVFLLHPEIDVNQLSAHVQEELFLMEAHNERYMEQWRA